MWDRHAIDTSSSHLSHFISFLALQFDKRSDESAQLIGPFIKAVLEHPKIPVLPLLITKP